MESRHCQGPKALNNYKAGIPALSFCQRRSWYLSKHEYNAVNPAVARPRQRLPQHNWDPRSMMLLGKSWYNPPNTNPELADYSWNPSLVTKEALCLLTMQLKSTTAQ